MLQKILLAYKDSNGLVADRYKELLGILQISHIPIYSSVNVLCKYNVT